VGETGIVTASSVDTVQRSWTTYLSGDLAASRRCFSDTFVAHVAGFPSTLGIDEYAQQGKDWLAAFPDFELDIQDQFASGERVVTRAVMRGTHSGPLLGIPATGRRVEISGLLIDRVEDGQIVERWANWDLIALMQQIGLMPPLGITETIPARALLWVAINGKRWIALLLGATAVSLLIRRTRSR
jgi:steroid delta-isomerase-like uncharacterized protein